MYSLVTLITSVTQRFCNYIKPHSICAYLPWLEQKNLKNNTHFIYQFFDDNDIAKLHPPNKPHPMWRIHEELVSYFQKSFLN